MGPARLQDDTHRCRGIWVSSFLISATHRRVVLRSCGCSPPTGALCLRLPFALVCRQCLLLAARLLRADAGAIWVGCRGVGRDIRCCVGSRLASVSGRAGLLSSLRYGVCTHSVKETPAAAESGSRALEAQGGARDPATFGHGAVPPNSSSQRCDASAHLDYHVLNLAQHVIHGNLLLLVLGFGCHSAARQLRGGTSVWASAAAVRAEAVSASVLQHPPSLQRTWRRCLAPAAAPAAVRSAKSGQNERRSQR